MDFLPSSSFSPSTPSICSELSDEFLSERLRVTMTEGLWSARLRSWGFECLGGQLEARAVSSLLGDEGSCLRTGTDTGMTSGRRLSSRGRFAFIPSDSVGLHGLCGSLPTCDGRNSLSEASLESVSRLASCDTLRFLRVLWMTPVGAAWTSRAPF